MIRGMSLRVLIADDEPLARERLRQFLGTEPGTVIVGECANGTEALAAIRAKSPDLVFLDVQMPELDGFGVLRALGETHIPAIIFITAYDQHAIRAFDAGVVDYLLKPFDRERLKKALQRGRERVRENQGLNSTRRISDLLKAISAAPAPIERLVIKSAGRVIIVKLDEIDWIRAADNYAELHVGKSVHLLRQTMTVLQQQLPPRQFARISRSLMVNVHRIIELHRTSHGGARVLLGDGAQLTVSRNHRRGLERLLGKPG